MRVSQGTFAGTVAVIQARMGSSRLPGKVLMDLAGRPVLAWVVRAARAIPGVGRVLVATSEEQADRPVRDWCAGNAVAVHAGPEQDVLRRIAGAAAAAGAGTVVRLTADCPMLDPWVVGMVVAARRASGADYATNADDGTWPDGLDCEVVTATALEAADGEAVLASDREHVLPFVRRNQDRFPALSVVCPVPGIGQQRWTLDDAQDLAFLRAMAAHLDPDRPPAFTELLEVLSAHPEIRRATKPPRNDGYAVSQRVDNRPPPDFARSQEMLAQALKVVPTASQTFSKSAAQLPEGHAPLFVARASGGRFCDVDGNEFVDMVCALLSVLVGYRDPVVDEALRRQLGRGISTSMPTRLEMELAERLVDAVPAAEAVRFAKNGSDATSAAVRIARSVTGRDRVIACGYHGWHDWYIGSTARWAGVPEAVRGLTHPVSYNDMAALSALFDRHPGEIAAVVMEPANFEEPQPGYLAGVRDLCHRHGALLVFDEIITGFRFARGGAQEYFGVTPDLACFGKGLGNGMPLSAVLGRRDLMAECERIFFSGTFGGEALSLAAGIAVFDLIDREPVIETLWRSGEIIATAARAAIDRHGLADTVTLKGWAPWTMIAIADHPQARKEAIRTLYLREMIRQGVFTLGSHNICYRHTPDDLARVAAALDEALGTVAGELASGGLEARLGHPAIEPVFQVRR